MRKWDIGNINRGTRTQQCHLHFFVRRMFSKSSSIRRTVVDVEPVLVINGRNSHQQRSNTDFSKLFRDVFHRSPKHRRSQTEKEMTNLSTTLIKPSDTTETMASQIGNTHKEDLCLFSDSPHYVVRVRLIWSVRNTFSILERRKWKRRRIRTSYTWRSSKINSLQSIWSLCCS